MKITKRIIALCIALVTLSCACISADAAAYYPTLTYYGSTNRSVQRGKSIPFKIALKANKFYSVSGKYRACMRIDCFDSNTGRQVAYLNPYNFTGNKTYYRSIVFPKSVFKKSGWYVMRLRLRIRNSIKKSFRTYKDKYVYVYVS